MFTPADGGAPWLAVRWTTAPVEKGWRLELELELEVPADADRGKDG